MAETPAERMRRYRDRMTEAQREAARKRDRERKRVERLAVRCGLPVKTVRALTPEARRLLAAARGGGG